MIGLLQPSAHARQRRPEVVRDIVAHLPDLSHQCFDAVQHQVKVLRNAIPFVMGAAERDAPIQAALHDGPAGGVDRFNPPHCPARHEDARDPRNHKQQCGGRDYGRPDLVSEAVEVADIPSHQQPIAAWKCLEHRPKQRPVCRVGQRLACAKLYPSARLRWLSVAIP